MDKTQNIEILAKGSPLGDAGVHLIQDTESGFMLVKYCPGNGSQYILLFQKLPEAACLAVGAHVGSWLVTDLNHTRRFMLAAEDTCTHLGYATEKLGAHAPVQAAIINVMVGDLKYGEGLLDSIRLSRDRGWKVF